MEISNIFVESGLFEDCYVELCDIVAGKAIDRATKEVLVIDEKVKLLGVVLMKLETM
jgi:hypothetical protein